MHFVDILFRFLFKMPLKKELHAESIQRLSSKWRRDVYTRRCLCIFVQYSITSGIPKTSIVNKAWFGILHISVFIPSTSCTCCVGFCSFKFKPKQMHFFFPSSSFYQMQHHPLCCTESHASHVSNGFYQSEQINNFTLSTFKTIQDLK